MQPIHPQLREHLFQPSARQQVRRSHRAAGRRGAVRPRTGSTSLSQRTAQGVPFDLRDARKPCPLPMWARVPHHLGGDPARFRLGCAQVLQCFNKTAVRPEGRKKNKEKQPTQQDRWGEWGEFASQTPRPSTFPDPRGPRRAEFLFLFTQLLLRALPSPRSSAAPRTLRSIRVRRPAGSS